MNTNYKIQVLRAIAIIAVVLIHTCYGGYYQVVCRPFINYAVALFIFLSGYLTKIDNSDWLTFCVKRIKRVIVPYVIWTVLFTLPSTNLKQYIWNLLTTEASPILYYIFVYIQFVLLTPLLGKLAKSKYRFWGFAIAPICLLGYRYSILLFDLHPHPYVNILWSISCCAWFTYYYLGLLLGNKLTQVTYKWRPLITWYILSMIIQIIEGYIWYRYFNVPNCGTQLKLSALFSSTILLLMADKYLNASDIKLTNKILKLLGDYSFGIYFIHMAVITILSIILPMYSSLPYVVNSMIVLIISFIIALAGRRVCGEKFSKWIGLI